MKSSVPLRAYLIGLKKVGITFLKADFFLTDKVAIVFIQARRLIVSFSKTDLQYIQLLLLKQKLTCYPGNMPSQYTRFSIGIDIEDGLLYVIEP